MPERSPAERRTRRIRVLVVEDNLDHQILITRRLEDFGADVLTATSGAEALSQLDRADIVLLDYQLPDMSGLDTLHAIRERGGPSVVMVTGMGSESIAVTAMRAGAIDYIVKDASYLTMIPEIIERAWRTHDLQRRTGKLQDLIRLVSEADDRAAIFSEIVNGASELLSAHACSLALLEETGLTIVASTEREPDMSDDLREVAWDAAATGQTTTLGRHAFFPLSHDERIGTLVVALPAEAELTRDETQLAETFASFAGLAVRKLRRHELERSLIHELEQTLEMRRDFVNSISHELRTPLACISGFSTTLVNYWGRLDETTTRSSIEKIQQHSNDLAALVDALLDFGAYERGAMEVDLGQLDLREQVEDSVAALKPTLLDRDVKVEVPNVAVVADPRLVRRVLAHLLSNAVKATDEGGDITVWASSDNGRVICAVSDTGRGMEADEVRRAFEPFYRSQESVKAARRGTGLGLALVREYVRSMGGEISLDSTPGEGTTARFTLPASEAHAGG